MDNLPQCDYEDPESVVQAFILASERLFEILDREFITEVTSFLDAIGQNKRSKWLADTFGNVYPSDLPDAEIISDLRMTVAQKYELSIAECESCGRIWV